jgi:cell division protein FtsA
MTDKSLQQEENSTNRKRSIVAGLDIGTTKIVCFIAQRDDHGKIDIIGVGKTESLGVSRGEIMNVSEATNSIIKAVQMAQDNLRLEGTLELSKVAVGIAGSHITSNQFENMLTRSNPNDLISEQELDDFRNQVMEMNLQNGNQIIDAIPQEYYIDNNAPVHNAAGCVGRIVRSNFHVMSGKIQNIELIYRCVKTAGLEIDPLVLEPIASAEAVLSKEEKEGGVVLVDIGGGTTDVAIVHENKIRHTAVIPFGGNVITNDIKNGCQILQRQAEALKVRYGSAIPPENSTLESISIPRPHGVAKEITVYTLSKIIEARLKEIIMSVKLEIDRSGYGDKLLGGIVVTGGGAQMKHITQLFEYITMMDTRIGYPTEHLSSNTDISEFSNPIFSTGLGLVLKGFQNQDKNRGKVKNEVEDKKIPSIEEDRGNTIVTFINKFKQLISDNMGSLMDDNGLKN